MSGGVVAAVVTTTFPGGSSTSCGTIPSTTRRYWRGCGGATTTSTSGNLTPQSTSTTITDLTQPQPRGPAEAGAVLPAGQRGLHQRPARAAGGGVARGQVTREAGSACLIVYMVMKCAGFLPSYMTAIGAWQETRKGSAVATVFDTCTMMNSPGTARWSPSPAGGWRAPGRAAAPPAPTCCGRWRPGPVLGSAGLRSTGTSGPTADTPCHSVCNIFLQYHHFNVLNVLNVLICTTVCFAFNLRRT